MTQSDLRARVLRGGLYLSIRQAAGTVIAVAGVLLLTRVIGPAQYGLYAAAIGLFVAVQLISQLGITVFLIRREKDLDAATLHTATTLFLVLGFAATVIGLLTLPAVQDWTRLEGLTPIAIAIYAGLPITNLTQIPIAIIERSLDYRRTAYIELFGQIVFLVVAVPLAFAGYGAWAAVAGWWTQQVSSFVLFHWATKHRPRFHWDSSIVRDALRYGVGYSASSWVYQLRRLVNPLIVGRYLGAEAVAIVSLAAQIATHLSFAGVAAWRLSMPALAQVQRNRAQLVRALNEGMRLQLIAVAPFLLLFAWAAPPLIRSLLGPQWQGVAQVFPYIAFAYLALLLFSLHSSALFVLRRNSDMTLYHIVHVLLLAVSAFVLVPRFGLTGYGVAELMTIPSFVVLHALTTKSIGKPNYGVVLTLAAGVAAGMFWQTFGVVGLLVLIGATVAARPWRDLRQIRELLQAAT